MRRAEPVARVLLGLIFLVFGLNNFLGFIPVPELRNGTLDFFGPLSTGRVYVDLFKIVQVVGALLLLAGRAVPLALVLLAPIIANILTFHLVRDREALPFALLDVALWFCVAWFWRGALARLISRAHQGVVGQAIVGKDPP